VFDMQLARGLQDRMLPDALPIVPGFDVGLAFKPARVVGGDLYDLIPVGDDSLILCVGDMPGKSVYGLVHLSMIHSHMRAGVREGLPPDQIGQLINRNAYDALQPDSYAALFIARLTVSTRILEFVNCGHLPPLLISPGSAQPPRELFSGGIVIGATRKPRVRPEFVTMQAGDVLILYTDGITEARNRQGEEFGPERLVAAALGAQAQDAAGVAQAIMNASERFSTNPSADDRTVLVLRAV
jgi:sigma-B regulation protein RsbU (phosphoserine phosphatase)